MNNPLNTALKNRFVMKKKVTALNRNQNERHDFFRTMKGVFGWKKCDSTQRIQVVRNTPFLLILLFFLVGLVTTAWSDNTPATYPQSGSTSGSGTAWTGYGNILANDNADATVSFNNTSGYSQYLEATNFGFSIPTNAVITGIYVTIGRYASHNSNIFAQRVQD